MRTGPARLERLPQQYFTALLARVAAEAAKDGEPLVDFGRGQPRGRPAPARDRGGPRAAADDRSHGYPEFRGMPELKEAVAARYRDVYGVELDPAREVAVVPGTKTALVELCLVLAERGDTVLLPDPGYPDYSSGGRARGRDARPRSARPDRPPDFGAAPRPRPLPELPLEPLRGRRAGGRLRDAVAARPRRLRRPRLRLRRPRLRRARAGELPRHARREGGRGRALLDVEDRTGWPAGGSASSSATRRSSSGSTCCRTTTAQAIFRPCRRPGSPR